MLNLLLLLHFCLWASAYVLSLLLCARMPGWTRRQQDEHLEDIEAAVSRLGRVGLTIHEELNTQVSTPCYHSVRRVCSASAPDVPRAATLSACPSVQ